MIQYMYTRNCRTGYNIIHTFELGVDGGHHDALNNLDGIRAVGDGVAAGPWHNWKVR